jgi:hypothetical protein
VLTASRICVGRGIAWPRSWKIVAKRGMTNVRQEDDGGGADERDHERIGEGGHHRVAERRARLQEFREAAQRHLEDAALLAGANHVHVEA